MTKNIIDLDDVMIGADKICLIAGPCVIESEKHTLDTAKRLAEIANELDIPFIFKASYDKANRTSISSYRGPGIDTGLLILEEVKSEVGCPIISDVHREEDIEKAKHVLDIIQIPAFLCRQTDIVVGCAETMKPVNIKKGQFMAPWDMKHVIAKATSTGNDKIMVTERGTSFGYNNLVVDMRSLAEMKALGALVVFDATHSVQLPGGQNNCSGGDRRFVPHLAKAAAAVGIDALFLEVHGNPDKAMCDAANSLHLDDLKPLLEKVIKINNITKGLSAS
ncbi:3-deoxy-8-phosphooctulonate synthase [Thermodesulfobacteriota bacterium]